MPRCPKCGGELKRIHRSSLDRALSLVYPMHRFSCKNPRCGFEGRMAEQDRVKKRMLYLLITIVGVMALIIFGLVIRK